VWRGNNPERPEVARWGIEGIDLATATTLIRGEEKKAWCACRLRGVGVSPVICSGMTVGSMVDEAGGDRRAARQAEISAGEAGGDLGSRG
jgi:hypothetical protein